MTGLAAGLCVGTAVALIALPYPQTDVSVLDRPRTSIIDTSLSLALLGFYVQLDVLIAPSVLAHGQATTYDLGAVPSKGVYLMLLAAGPLVFPSVRRLQGGGKRLIVVTAAVAWAVGARLAAWSWWPPARSLLPSWAGRRPVLSSSPCSASPWRSRASPGIVVNSECARGVETTMAATGAGHSHACSSAGRFVRTRWTSPSCSS